jgi:hypothetical protein
MSQDFLLHHLAEDIELPDPPNHNTLAPVVVDAENIPFSMKE